MFKHCQALGLFCDSMIKNVLLHQRDAVRVQRNQFHHEVGSAPESSATESYVH